jgi:hypothetical protein
MSILSLLYLNAEMNFTLEIDQSTNAPSLSFKSLEIYQWLSPLFGTFLTKHKEIKARRGLQPGAAQLQFQSAKFQDWLNGLGKTLWCIGIRKLPSPNFLLNHSQLRRIMLKIPEGAGKTVFAYISSKPPVRIWN